MRLNFIDLIMPQSHGTSNILSMIAGDTFIYVFIYSPLEKMAI